MTKVMDTSSINDGNASMKFNFLVKKLEDLQKNCSNQELLSIYKLIKLFFKYILKFNVCINFLEYTDLIEMFLELPENIRLTIIKILSRKPIKYPGRIFNEDEISTISQNKHEIRTFINAVPKEKISLHFLISNTFEYERIDYYRIVTEKCVTKCSVEKLMTVLVKLIKEETLDGSNVFNYFFNLLKGVYRVDITIYKIFSSMVFFFYSNEISRLGSLNHNIFRLYINKKGHNLNPPNKKLLEKSKLILFTNVVMLYFGILNNNHIVVVDDYFSVYVVDEIIENYQILLLDGCFDKFDESNFQNSTEFILFKCMKFMADNFISVSKFEIAKELFEAMICTYFFTQIPKYLQYKLLLDYCILLRQMNKSRNIKKICKKFCRNLSDLPLYYAVNFYKLYLEEKLIYNNRKYVAEDEQFLPILEGTIKDRIKKSDLNSKNFYSTIINDLKGNVKCSKAYIFNKNLWNEVCLLLIINQLNNQEIDSFFNVEQFLSFSKNRIIKLLKITCKLLLNLEDRKNIEIISKNYDLYTKYRKKLNYNDINFESIDDYISFLSCLDIKLMIKFMAYMLKNPYKGLDQEFIYLWETKEKRCYVAHLEVPDNYGPFTLKKRCALFILKKLLHISCYSIEYEF